MQQYPCPKCGGRDSRVVREGPDFLHGVPGTFSISQCSSCRLWFQNPRPGPGEADALYPPDYRPHSGDEQAMRQASHVSPGVADYLRDAMGYDHLARDSFPGRNWKSWRLFRFVRSFQVKRTLVPAYVPEGKLLEVGSGNGARLHYFKQLGWAHVQGIELVAPAVEVARRQGLDVIQGTVEAVLPRLPERAFDVVYSTMVLEHLANPFAVVDQMAAKLKPGGQFLFSTITRDSLDARIYGRFWAGLDFPRHVVLFRIADIQDMLRKHFDRIEIFHQSETADYTRSSGWRLEHGEGKPLDRLVRRLGPRGLRMPLLALALLAATCRISVRCRKKD